MIIKSVLISNKLANTYDDLLDFYVANFKNDVKYVGDMLNEHGERYYREHKKVCESLTYTFENDINKLYESNSDFNALLEAKDNEHPFVITYWLQDEIHLETVVILDSITGFVDRENKKISETIIWPDIFRKITKYKPFVKFDKTKCVNILKKTFTKTQ